jgi:hypothetical protein
LCRHFKRIEKSVSTFLSAKNIAAAMTRFCEELN